MTVTINEAEARLRLALAAKADSIAEPESADATAPFLDATVIRLRSTVGPARPSRRRWAAVAVAAAVALVVGSAIAISVHGRTTGSAPARPNPNDIPWSQVGPGWGLVVTAPPTGDAATALHTLVLASPTGVDYPITHFVGDVEIGAGTWNHQTEQVMGTTGSGVLVIDLRTGNQRRVPLTRPTTGIAAIGAGFLIEENGRLESIDATGRVLNRFEGSNPQGFVVSQDGTGVAVGTATGLALYDAHTGKISKRWTALPGTVRCTPLAWLPGDSMIQGICNPRQVYASDLGANFSLTTGATTARTVAGGWGTIRLADGTVAYRLAGQAAPQASVPLTKAVEFARVEPSGTLTPLAKPAEFDQGSWLIYYILPRGFLILENDVNHERVVVWNPLTGQLSTYFDGPGSGGIVTGFDVWS